MTFEENESLLITEEEEGMRLDKILANRFLHVKSRTYFQDLIDNHHIFLNGFPVKKRVKPKRFDEVEIHFILNKEMGLTEENIPLEIVFEDEHILVVNKPAGMVVHPAPGHWNGTFVNALLYHCKDLMKDDLNLRPGIVHRLDKDTTGLLIAAKHTLAHQRLVASFAAREVHKEYTAICIGNPGNQEIRTRIGRHPVLRKQMAVLQEGGKEAHSICKTISYNERFSLVNIVLETGRTHQIRVHMKHLNTPILGCPVYGNPQVNKKYQVDRQMLHASFLSFNHPITNKHLKFNVEFPSDMKSFIQTLRI